MGKASQVGGWSIPGCATFLPPAPAPVALQLFAHSSVPKADPGVLCRDKIHAEGSFLELLLTRKEELSELMGLPVLPLAQECHGERKKVFTSFSISINTVFKIQV